MDAPRIGHCGTCRRYSVRPDGQGACPLQGDVTADYSCRFWRAPERVEDEWSRTEGGPPKRGGAVRFG